MGDRGASVDWTHISQFAPSHPLLGINPRCLCLSSVSGLGEKEV